MIVILLNPYCLVLYICFSLSAGLTGKSHLLSLYCKFIPPPSSSPPEITLTMLPFFSMPFLLHADVWFLFASPYPAAQQAKSIWSFIFQHTTCNVLQAGKKECLSLYFFFTLCICLVLLPDRRQKSAIISYSWCKFSVGKNGILAFPPCLFIAGG